MDSTTKILICRLAGEEYPPPAVPSSMDYCSDCSNPVWRADSSPASVKVLCTRCALAVKLDEKNVAALTEAQKEDIAQYYLDHPEEAKRDFGMQELAGTGPEDIQDLCVVIERLLDHLRELRRTAPEKFFDQPVESLYESLEAAVSSFYRAGVSGQRDPIKDDPRGSQER